MAVEVTTLVKLARLGSPTLKAVAWAMADYANKEGAGVYPSNNTIADDTELSRGCVIATIKTLTTMGILAHDERSLGGAHRATTIREFNLDRLLEISRGNRKLGIPAGPSEVRKVRGEDGKATFAIVPFEIADDADGEQETNEEQTLDGSSTMTGHPGGPVIQDDSTGHPGGLHGSSRMTQSVKNRQRTVTLPPTPQGGGKGGDDDFKTGWAKSWSPEAIGVAAEIRSSPRVSHVVTALLDAVRGTLWPPKDVDGAAYIRQLAAKLGEFPADVLAAVAVHLGNTQTYRMLPALDLVAIARAEAARLGVATTGQDAPPVGDPALAAAWPDIRAGLCKRFGDAFVSSWFSTVAPVRIDDGQLVLATRQKFVRSYLAVHAWEGTLQVARQVLPAVTAVKFSEAA